MRKRRAIIYDDDDAILEIMRVFFVDRAYEVVTSREPVACPAHDARSPCSDHRACADIVVSDFRMPELTGAERIQLQIERGCPIPFANKAIMSADIFDPRLLDLRRRGLIMFEKPIDFDALAAWVGGRESRMDLRSPLALVRRETRSESSANRQYVVTSGNEDLPGVAVNTSRCGVCVQTAAPLAENDVVTVRPLGEASARPAQVRWVRNQEAGSYLAGLYFAGCF